MKILLIGYGSIGKRHEYVLKTLLKVDTIDIVTKQKLDHTTCYTSIDVVKDIDSYDYFVIASETSKHFSQLKKLDYLVKNKLILCEKPLFIHHQEVTYRNNVFVGYTLRYHPLIKKLRIALKNQNVLSADITACSYLPDWRPNQDYKKSYSASKELGGGVLLDLSHEVDLIHHLFGKIEEIYSYQDKISSLEITSDDYVSAICKSDKEILMTLSMNYFSLIPKREILLHTKEFSILVDLINNRYLQHNKVGKTIDLTLENFERDDMFLQMHRDIFSTQTHTCTLDEAKEVMQSIDKITKG